MVKKSYYLISDDELLRKAKIVAIIKKTTLKAVLNEFLEDFVADYDIPNE